MRIVLAVFLILFCVHTVPVLADSDDVDFSGLFNALTGLKIGGLYYLSYQNGEQDDDSYSEFYIHRAYLTVEKSILPYLDSRLTLDTSQDMDGDGRGDMEIRLKYVYAKFKLPDYSFLTKQNIEFGMVHGPWLDFEEHVNYYRMREKMFVERLGIINSADFGVTYAAYFGGEMDDDYKQRINNKYAGKYGSVAFGIYNGGGYHAVEENQNNVFEGRLTLRPLSGVLPGLQISGFEVFGKGNDPGTVDHIPDFNLTLAMLSYEHQVFTVTGQYMVGEGNQKGTWVQDDDPEMARKYDGYSLFGELKPGDHWRLIGGYDSFDPDTDVNDDEFARYYVAGGYDFGHHNILLLGYDIRDFVDEDLSNDNWFQITMQIHF